MRIKIYRQAAANKVEKLDFVPDVRDSCGNRAFGVFVWGFPLWEVNKQKRVYSTAEYSRDLFVKHRVLLIVPLLATERIELLLLLFVNFSQGPLLNGR